MCLKYNKQEPRGGNVPDLDVAIRWNEKKLLAKKIALCIKPLAI